MNMEEREQDSRNEQFPRKDAMQNKDNDLGAPLDNSVTNDEEQLITQDFDRGDAFDEDDNLDNKSGLKREGAFDEDDESEDDDLEDEETEDDDLEDDDDDNDDDDDDDDEDDFQEDDNKEVDGDIDNTNPINPERF